MLDDATIREIIAALQENGRGANALATTAHRGLSTLESHSRTLFALGEQVDDMRRELAHMRSTFDTFIGIEAARQDLRREELDLQRDKMEADITGEVARNEKEVKVAEERTKLVQHAFTSKGGLIVCGATVVILLQAVFGTGPLLDLLSGLVALSHAIGGSAP